MAYGHLYGSASSTAELLTKIRDFGTSIGWTVADDYSLLANAPFIALKSNGESGQDDFGIMFEKSNQGHWLIGNVFYKWSPVAPYWAPSPGLISQQSSQFTAKNGAPSFLTWNGGSGFAVGDYLWTTNQGSSSNGYGNLRSVPRMKVTAVTATVLIFQTGDGYPYIFNSDSADNAATIISEGGPGNLLGRPQTTNYSVDYHIATSASPFAYFLFGDKDAIICITRSGSNYNGMYLGMLTPYHQLGRTRLTAIATHGDTTIQVADSSFFIPGYNYILLDPAGDNLAPIKVTAVDHGTKTVTLSTGIVASNGAGTTFSTATTWAGDDPMPLCASLVKPGSSNGAYAFCPDGQWGVPGRVWGGSFNYPMGHAYNRFRMADAFPDCFWRDDRRWQYGFMPCYIRRAGDLRGAFKHVYHVQDAPGSSEDFIRLSNDATKTYKIFNLGGDSSTSSYHWYVVKE